MNKNLSIMIVDNVPPESIAMVQAKYSRSPDSAENHLQEVEERGPEKFMASYYVGYGHKSIGDCGSISLFFEGISMLAAKAIQDTPLYSGQEASTRYMDMSKQVVMGGYEGRVAPKTIGIQAVQMAFYEEILSELKEYLTGLYPIEDGEDATIYNKAIKAKAFDIARGFLPAGVTTNVSWHTNLRQAHDHLKELKHHPLKEVSEIAILALEKLKEKYPSSFSHKEYEKDEAYVNSAMNVCTYYDSPGFVRDRHQIVAGDASGNVLLLTSWHGNGTMLDYYKQVYMNRPAKSELPKQLRACGTFNFQFQLDFGSFRDFQRHRSVVQPMPLLTTKFGFEQWYINQLPPHLVTKVQKHLSDIMSQTKMLEISEVDQQYYIPMGYKVMCHVDAPFSAAVYLAELRSSQTVHPTLRTIANMWSRAIEMSVPDIELHYDNTPDAWSTKRGKQDIVEKK